VIASNLEDPWKTREIEGGSASFKDETVWGDEERGFAFENFNREQDRERRASPQKVSVDFRALDDG
jgi:hypothetical protein